MASGGRKHACSDLMQCWRTAKMCHCDVRGCNKQKEENVTLRERTLQEFELYNEEVHPSKDNDVVCSLVDSTSK